MDPSRQARAWRVAAVVLAVLLLAAVAWAVVERQRGAGAVETERAERQQVLQRQTEAQAQVARQQLDAETTSLLQAVGVPLGWTVRREVGAGNLGQVRAYFGDLINYPSIRQVELLDPAATVQVSTDRGREGQPAGTAYPADWLKADKPTVFARGGEEFVLVVPVFGLSAQEGVVLLTYRRSAGGQK